MVYVFRTFFGFTWIFCWLYLHVAVISPVVANPIEGDVRLVDGGADNQGRIEIYYNDTWWALCQSHFNHDAFNTVCKKLSLPEPHEQFHESQFGPGNQSILPMDFSCDGHESSLMDCRHEDFYSHHCGAHNTVGVSCGELVMKDCGGDRMDIFGKLNFLRGPKPNERECKWTLGNAGNPEGYQVIVNTYYDSEDCGSQVRMREPMEDHDFNHDDLCGDNRFRIYEFPKSRITLTVEQHHSDEDVPFDGAYAISNGRMDDALQVSGWDVTTINKTERSVHVQWPQLSSEIDKAVRAYIVVAAFQHHGEKHGRIVSSDNSSVEILGLSPFKEYQITVFALDEASQLHKSNEISVTTDEGVPRSPPNYHGYMIDEAGCVRLHWDPIAEHDRNGLILGYIITYIADCFDNPDDHDYTGNTTVSSSSNSATLCQLRPGSKYSIGLSGYTSKGIGPYRHDTIYAGCGQERVLTEINGTISSPNKPCPYGGYQSCMWSINPSANTPKAIWMRFTEFRLRYDHDHDQDTSCRSHDWVGLTTVGDGSGVLLCRHLDHFTVLVTDSHVDMSFSTRRREEGDGFYVSYEGVQNDFTATQLSSWNVSVEIQMFSADITWADYPHGDPIQEMFVMYTQTNDNITVMLPVEQLDSTEYHMESILLADRVYIFQVCAFTGGIEDAIYCSQNVTIRTMERAPEEAPHNVRLERLLNNEILVTWYPLSDMQANGQVRRYTVHYREWQDHYQWHEDWEQVMSINVSSSEDHHVLSGLDGGRKYQIAVSAFTVGFGPPSEWQTIVIGCGGTFGGYFGRFNIRQWNWEALDCSWTIEKPQSIGSAVGRAIIFAANGSEVADVEDYECDQDIRGKILEIPFGETDLLTLKLHTEHDGSHFMAEFLILTEGYSAQPSPAQWDLTTSISDDGSVWIDFSGYSGSLDASFFSVLFNKTMSDRDYEDHHHDDENKEMFFLYSVNSSETSLKAFGLPVFTNFTTTGYVIEKDNDIYKSEELIVETGEGVPSEAPHIYDYHINDAGCVELNWNQISEEHRNGKIIGYVVSYETSCYSGEDDRSHSGYVNVSALSMSATICDLHSGLQYRVGVAGYTSVGMGHFNHRDDIFAGCKEKLILTGSNGTIESPNRPCQYGGRQHCAWSIQPNNPTNEIWIDFEDSSRLEEYEYEMGCKANDRIAFTTNENVTEAYICREIRNYLIQITRSQVDVSFHARGEPHRRGEGFSAFYHASQESFFNITQLSSWNLTVTVDRISADIQWTSFPLGVSIGDMYLRFSVVDSNVYVLIPVNEADQSYHMRNLLMSGEIYVFDLVAVSSEDEGYAYSSLSVTVETEEGPPETAPESVNVELLTHDSVLVTWDPLPEEVSGYTVYFKHEHEGHDEQSVNVSSSDSQRVLNSLEGGRSYQVSVAAFTIDWGPRSEWKTFMVGCGGSFHGYFGLFNLTQFDWNELHCTWTINNPGLANPVVYIAAHDVQLRSCEGSTKAYNSDHLEIWHHGGCSSVRGELAEIPFDGSSFLTLELQMKHEGSYVRSEYFILDGDKNLNSAVATAWEITHSITDDGRVLLDLSGFPANIDASYFIISMNKTKDNKEYHEEHHDYNEEDNGGWYLFAVNSSSTYFDIAGAPAFKNFTGVVYVVDTANEIFKSQEFQVQTGEGVPSESPHVEDIHIDENDCVEIKWNPIPEEHHNGIIRGYRISYYTECRSDDDPSSHSGHVDRPASDRYYKLCGLHTGLQYRVRVAGFTSKGAGHSEDREVFTSCGAPQTLTQSNGPINSPNKPCQYGGNQFCQWSIRPSSPTQAIWIKFWEFRLEEYVDSADCWSNDWVSISKGASGVASLMCRHVESFQVIVSSDQVDVGFYAKGEHHRRGDGFYAFYHAMDAVAEIHVPSWSFSANVDHLSVEFTWSSLSLGVHVDEYAVRFTQDGVSVMLPVGEHDGSRHWRNLLLPSRNYTFDVVAIAGKTIYSSQNVSAMTPEGAPGVAPPNVQAQVLPLNRILIMWDPIPSKYANGVLRGYKVYLREYRSHYEWSDDGELGEVYDVSLLETQLLLIGLDGGRKYQISAAACTVDVGPHSQWESLQVGCGGSFNGFFGAVDVTQWDWESRLDCSWTIGNNGVSNAFLLISAQEIDLHSCEDWVGVYASDGAELDRHVKCCHDHGECSDHVRGELRRVSFGNSDYLTLKVHTEHERSRVKSEFCVLEEGKDIDSALPSPSPWNVKTEILDEGGVLVNLTGDPANHDVSFYIIDMNKTQSQDDHYWGRVERYLHMVNASENLGRVTGIPVYSDYNAVVYRVDTSHDVYRSDEFYFQTPEGVPSEGPHHFEYKIMSRDSVYIEWSEISEEHHNGLLLGFSISYRPQCSDEGSSTQITIDLWTRSYTISGLLPATQYDISIAGYTAAGVGKRRHMDFTTSCGGLRTLTEVNGTVEGPNYPCRYRGPQYCRWTIQPSVQTKTIIMMFEDFRLDRDGDSYCSANDWLGISTGLFNNDTQFCGHHMDRFQLIITSSQVDLAFYAREHREGDSFSASYYSLDTDITKIQPPSWTMSVDSTESTKAHVSWVEFPLNDKNRDSFFLKIKEANKNISLLIPVEEWDRSRHIEGLYPNREYEVQVLLFTGPDFQHDIYSCQMVSFTTQQGAPSMAPLNVRMESKDGNSVSVSVDPLPISHHGGVLGGYYVYYTSDEHHYDPSNPGTKIELGPSETHTVIHGLEQMREYFIFASAFNEHGEGPRSQRQSIVLGCGGSFNQTFGELSLSKSDWDDRHCIWKIHDSGTENAFLLLSVHAMHFHHCGHEYAKVYSNDGELLSYTDCSEVRGEVFELAFGDSGVITIDILIQNMESYMWTEFVILKGGLQSAQPSPTPWNITGESMDRNIIVDWRSYPVDLNVSIFIISFNQTKMPEFEDHHHDEERKPLRILQVVNSSTTDFIIRDLPTAMEFAAVVYLVDSNNDIYKSERAIFMTEEGVPTEGPHLHNWRVNLDDRSFSFEIRPLNEESRGGILLGYTIIYAPLSDPNNTQTRVVAEDIQGVTLTNLNESETYYILIAGHTSKGVGKMRAFTATFCGGRIEENTALISSPNYPGTPFIAPDQHDDNPRCYWNIRPQSEVSAIFIKFNDFFLGRREDWGGCSGGIKLYFPDRSEHDDDNGIELCGRVPDVTVLVFGNVLDIKAWGFGNQRWDEEYRNGTRFQLDYEAVPGELTTVIGEEIDSWALTEITPSNVTCNLSWPEPPGDFLGGSSLEKYLIIYGGPWDDIYGTLTTYETQAMIEWLDPSKNYTVKVVAVLHDGRRGCIAWTDFETTEGVPATNPHIEWIKAIDYSTILLQWRPMKKTEVRGILRGYRVCIEQTEHHHESQPSYRKETFGPEQLEATITGLPSETEFRVWVAAFTAVGEGNPRHERWIRTKCGSPLHDGYGTIQSRGYPDKFQHGDCVWHIHTYNQSVLLSFEDFNIPHSHECRDFYVAVEDNSGMDPKPLCGDIGHFSVLVQAHRVSVLSHAESEQDYARGFRLNYLTLNNSVWEAELDPSWTLSISNPQSYSADAVWTQYSQQQDLFLYAVVCTPTLGEAGPTIATVDKGFNSSTVERLRPYTNYTAQVLALFKAASGEITFKGSLEVYIKTDEGVPSKPPENVEATAEVSTIHVSWQHIPQNDINGILIGYRIFYRMVGGEGDDEGENEQYSEWNVGPTDLQASIGNLSNSQTYRIFVAGVTKIGVGEVSEPVHARPGCEHTVHDRMRVVSSPGFPNNYPHETQCYWVFELDLPHYEVIVVIDTFHLETSDGGPNCTNWVTDFLGLFNIEPLYVAAGPFCGLKSSFAVTGRGSKHHRSVLYMQTNNGFAFKGFNGTYFVIAGESKITVSLDDIDIHEAQITWQISADAEQVQEYFVLYKPITEKEMWKFKKTTAQEATLVPLQSGIEYSIRVVGYSASEKVYSSAVIKFNTTGVLETTPTEFTPTTPPIDRMYPYGPGAGDTLITFDIKCFKVDIPNGGMRFFRNRHRKLYICPNGVIQFERDRIIQGGPYNFGQRPWLRYMAMLAPYWAPTHLRSFIDGPSKVYYHVYQGPADNATLDEATYDALNAEGIMLPQGKTFKATWAIVVTWQDLRHERLNDKTKNLYNTFQAVVMTDGIFSFAMANFNHGGIQFSAPTTRQYYELFSDYKRFPVFGWNAGDGSDRYWNHQRSGTIQIEEVDTLVGNAGIPGRYIARIEDSDGEEDGDLKCLRWFNREQNAHSGQDEPDPCPCTGIQAFFDERYEWVEPDFPSSYCFYTRFQSRGGTGRGRKCCYYTSREKFAALIIGFPGGGSLHRFHQLTPGFKQSHARSDVAGFRHCCLEARNPFMCDKYYELRPSEGCEKYEPPEWSWLWGDPHIVTLDGGNYTFNGLGEYTMVDVQDGMFQLQARTKLAKGQGQATVFVAAVAKEEQTSTVQANLKDEGGLEVLVDGEVYQNFSTLTNVSVMLSGSVAVSRPENNSFLMSFPSGISVTVTEIQGSLSIVFAAPSNFKNHTKGLLGTWNGDTSDDFLRPDGITLPYNSTGNETHFGFGLTWQVTSNTTLFTYNPGENVSTFADPSFVPIFVDDIQFANDTLRQQAEEICQGDVNCLFDIASTGDTAVGESTKQTSVQLESDSSDLQNFPPKILVGPTEINVTVNTMATVTVVAEDPNNDSLSFTVSGTLPAGYTKTSNDSSVTLSWSVTTTKIDIEFIVSDGSVNTVLRPVINVCACQNQGICTSLQEEDADNSDESNDTSRFNVLPCNCQNGYTGDFCDADLDACEENLQPCFPGVQCNDLPPPANETGFQCDPCPSGYSGDGIQCLDVDECAQNSDGCEHNCINTPGSFVCTCNSGYFLNLDKKTCQDIDECDPVSDCMHICENTMGSYNCKCNQDFKVDNTDPKKCVPQNPCEGQHGCQHVCFSSDGQDKCSCNAGYALDQDGKSCSDIDECATNQHRCTQGCKNSVGSYSCSCVDGFILDSDGYNCNDVDECLEWTFNCTDASQKCENTYGSYKCVCDEGLYWIDNMCKGLEKGQAPPPPPTAPPPRAPSDEERSEAVQMILSC